MCPNCTEQSWHVGHPRASSHTWGVVLALDRFWEAPSPLCGPPRCLKLLHFAIGMPFRLNIGAISSNLPQGQHDSRYVNKPLAACVAAITTVPLGYRPHPFRIYLRTGIPSRTLGTTVLNGSANTLESQLSHLRLADAVFYPTYCLRLYIYRQQKHFLLAH